MRIKVTCGLPGSCPCTCLQLILPAFLEGIGTRWRNVWRWV